MERDNDSLLTIWDYHRIEAFPGSDNLAIKKKLLKNQKNWTPEMLQRYGFLMEKPNNSLWGFNPHYFVHEVYQSFFAVQFIITSFLMITKTHQMMILKAVLKKTIHSHVNTV